MIRLLVFGFCLILTGGISQSDPVLFSVNDVPVKVSEFRYIYNKNNGDQANYSRESLEEYLNLYIRFKLKVQRAMELRMDTIPALQSELETYRRQLANSYLMDKEIMTALVEELYERMQTDVDISHIFTELPPNPEDRLVNQVMDQMNELFTRLQNGESFRELARAYSDDGSTSLSGGRVGFVTAMLPDGFYELENAIYTLKIGEFSRPVKTSAGVHIVMVNDRRPARGEIEAAHIFVRKGSSPDDLQRAKRKVDSLHWALENKSNFADLAIRFSEDRETANNGGRIGYFGINRFDRTFEDAAFSLKNIGDYSKPVETETGWHIIQLWNRRPLQNLEQMRSSLRAQIERDGRHEIAKKAMIERIKRDSKFFANNALLKDFEEQLDESFLSYQWQEPKGIPAKSIILSFNNQDDFLLSDFVDFLKRKTRERMRFQKDIPISEALSIMFEQFADECALKFEEKYMRQKYSDFDALMREYEEGILLFEVTKETVWDRASADTTGLRKFHEENRGNYLWPARANLISYELQSDDDRLVKRLLKQIQKKSRPDLLESFNKKGMILSYTSAKVDNEDPLVQILEWKEHSVGRPECADGKCTVKVIEDILDPQPKALHEARGYVIADYQDYLEDLWVESLKERYEIKVNEEVFNSLVRN